MNRTIKEDWACQIIAQALMDIGSPEDAKRVAAKVANTAVGARPDILREFRKLVKAKVKMLGRR